MSRHPAGYIRCPACKGDGYTCPGPDGRCTCRASGPSDCNCLVDCVPCDGTGKARAPDTHCACCAREASVGEAPALVDGACPACVENECACVVSS